MRIFKNFFKIGLLFAPSLIFMMTFNRWAGLRIALMHPVSAVNFIISGDESIQTASGINPFRNFSLSDFTSSGDKSQTEDENNRRQSVINPNYSVKEEFFASAESDIILKKDRCYVKNLTDLPRGEVKDIMLSPVGFKCEKNSQEPQILILHTHATESYLPSRDTPYNPNYSFRSTDKNQNMTAVGAAMAERLNRLGYNTIQDDTLHDYPSYNGSYDKSKATTEYYLEKYPSIKVVLDVHRDAAEREGTIISPVVTINDKKRAQIMIISGADNGSMNMPNYKENLKFATAVQNKRSKLYPGLMRSILFDYRNYNQQLTTGSILVEVGTHGATLDQAVYAAQLFADSLAAALDEM